MYVIQLRNISQIVLILPCGRIPLLLVLKFTDMPETPKKLTKPKMRGLLKTQIMVNVGTAITLGIITGVLFKFFVCDARKKKYEDFYSEYDPAGDLTHMLKLGADFQSAELR